MSSSESTSNTLYSDIARAYWEDICDFQPLPVDEQKRLMTLIKAGDKKALDTFVESYLRFVYSRAKKYCFDFDSFLDLVQAGNIGLIAAISGFDPDRGIRFITYATYWVDRYIRSESFRSRKVLRLPEHAYPKVNQLLVVREEFYQINHRYPSNEELADILNIPASSVADLLQMSFPSRSLDRIDPSQSFDELSLLQTLSDPNATHPEDHILAEDTKKTLLNFMRSNLTSIEYEVLKTRFGIETGSPAPLRVAADACGISIEGARKVEMRAMNKLQKAVTETGLTYADFV